MHIEARDLTKKFGSYCAVDRVTFTVSEGECFGLLGPNGAGKSTILSMLYGASPRTDGYLRTLGFDPAHQSRQLKHHVGVVTQENALDETMTVRENMLMFARFIQVPPKLRAERVDHLLEFMSLSHKADANIKALSGGMQRRLVFVRALLGRPKLVILDEPTTGLDPAVRQLLWNKVEELKRSGVTILLTTHYMDEAERLCDRLVILEQGKIRAEGAPKRLIEDHCPGYIAIFSEGEATGRAAAEIAARDPAIEVSEETGNLVLRTAELDRLTAIVQTMPHKPLLIRPANLEDVFLHITGRELSVNA